MPRSKAFTPVVNIGEWLRANSNHLYKSNRVVLRETLQNAIDAIRMSKKAHSASVEISYDRKQRRLFVRDNGIGMSLDQQRNSFWQPYGSSKRILSDERRMKAGVIGRFGIGAYSSFRVAQRMIVVSRPELPSRSPIRGTTATLDQPLDSYALRDAPAITFRSLSASEAESQWPSNQQQGTIIAMDLVRALDEREARATLKEASAYLHEKVVFQGRRLNSQRKLLPSLPDNRGNRVIVDVRKHCATKKLRQLVMQVIVRGDGTAAVQLRSATLATQTGSIEVECGGVLELSKRKRKGILLLKHQFHFAKIADTASWVQSLPQRHANSYSLEFDGVLDLPFLDPDVSREGFSEEGQIDMAAILICASHAIISALEKKGGDTLRRCEQLFQYLGHSSHKERERILDTYPFRLFGGRKRVTLRQLKDRRASDETLNVVFITDEADTTAEQLAKSLSTLESYCVIKVDEPTSWPGYIQQQVLEGCFGARNVAGASSFHSVLSDDEIGNWSEYRPAFTAALDAVIGSGHQVQLAHIEPKTIALVAQEGTRIIYLNYHNPEVAELPDKQLFGVSLEAKIRSWLFGKVKAAQLEEALVKEGKLVIVQKVISVYYVKEPEIGNYVAERDHQLLLIDRHGTRYFALRVSNLCVDDVKRCVDHTGVLRSGLSAQLTWVGSTFYFTITDAKGVLDTLVLTFHTGVALRNPALSDTVEGRSNVDFAVEQFRGPKLSGSVLFFVLPDWIGELLEEERTKRGHVMISMWSETYSDSDTIEGDSA